MTKEKKFCDIGTLEESCTIKAIRHKIFTAVILSIFKQYINKLVRFSSKKISAKSNTCRDGYKLLDSG